MGAQRIGQHPVEPDAIEQRMASGRWQNDRRDIRPMYEMAVTGAIENVDELVLRMLWDDPPKCLMREPADTFELAGQQQTGVHSDPHGAKVRNTRSNEPTRRGGACEKCFIVVRMLYGRSSHEKVDQ